MIGQILLKMTDPNYMKAYLAFIPFILLAGYGIALVWKAATGNNAKGIPRWMYYVAGLICMLPLPAYTIFMNHQGFFE